MSYLELPDGTRMEIFGKGGGSQLAESAGVPLLGAIPLEPDVRHGGDEGIPIVVSSPDSAAGKVLRSVAEKIAAAISVLALQKSA
jgi:ATP-binding protein involved in chromosome partitioning